MKRLFLIIQILLCIMISVHGQENVSLSYTVIWSGVKVPNNWNPPTAVHRRDTFSGTATGYGPSLTYSFQPFFITNRKELSLALGIGYFEQRFNINRPFDYPSELYAIFVTDHYSYSCLQYLVGMSYNYHLPSNYSISAGLTYIHLTSFRQKYSPPYTYPAEIRHNRINFGKMLNLPIAVQKRLAKKMLVEISILVPLYTGWRNDQIFKDDPTMVFHPRFSAGSAIKLIYDLENVQEQR